MELTGQCKKDFENYWCNKNPYKFRSDALGYALGGTEDFYNLPFSMQYGVYVDFFDSKDIIIDIMYGHFCFEMYVNQRHYDTYKTRPEAQKEAIKKANSIYNENRT